jgi:hypothetical protein
MRAFEFELPAVTKSTVLFAVGTAANLRTANTVAPPTLLKSAEVPRPRPSFVPSKRTTGFPDSAFGTYAGCAVPVAVTLKVPATLATSTQRETRSPARSADGIASALNHAASEPSDVGSHGWTVPD